MVLLGREAEEPVSRRIARDVRLVDGRDGKLHRDVAVRVADGLLVRLVERRLVLVDEDAVVAQCLVARAVELAREEALCGTVRIGRVDDDEVVFGLLAAHVAESLLEPHLDALVLQLRGRERQVLLREQNHLLVDLDEVDGLDRPVLRQLPHRAAVAAADHEHVLDARVHGHRHVREHLMIDELVRLRDHEPAVQDEDASVRRRIEDVDLLNGALLRHELLGRLDGEPDLARVFVCVPEFHGESMKYEC